MHSLYGVSREIAVLSTWEIHETMHLVSRRRNNMRMLKRGFLSNFPLKREQFREDASGARARIRFDFRLADKVQQDALTWTDSDALARWRRAILVSYAQSQ